MRKKNSDIATFLIVLLVIVVIIIFVVSLGSVNPSDIGKIPQAFKDSKEEAKRRHQKLVELIKKQEALKIKLNKKFKRIYFFVRVGLVILWLTALYICYFLGLIKTLGDALNYSEASILILIVFNFLTFGTLTNLENYLHLVKTKTENWIYGKYLTIENKIETNKSELTVLAKKIEPPKK
jgi:hypothetical protein